MEITKEAAALYLQQLFDDGLVDACHGPEIRAAIAHLRASPAPAAGGMTVPDMNAQVPGIPHPTTYADLARISPNALWNRWYPTSGKYPDAKEAFIAARKIPFVAAPSAGNALPADSDEPPHLTIGDAAKSVGAWQDNDDVSGYVHFGSWMAVHAFVQKMQAPLIAALRDVGYSKPVTASPAQMLNFVQGVAKDALAAQPAAPESAAAPAARPGHVLVPIVPSEDQWGGLARDIVMWLDMCEGMRKTPRNLFRHLEDLGRDVPQWLRDEPEMKNLDHVPSKGTRAAIIYRAMVEAAQADHSAQAQADTVEVPRGLLGAACHIIRKTEPDSETLKQLRRFTTGDLSVATAQAQAGEVALPEPVAFLCVDTDPDKGFGLHPRYTANRNYNTKTIPEDGCHYVFTADQLRAYGNARALAAGAGMQEQTMKGGA